MTQDVPPSCWWTGTPGRAWLNVVGLRRRGFRPSALRLSADAQADLSPGSHAGGRPRCHRRTRAIGAAGRGEVAMMEEFLADATRGIVR